VRTGRQPVVAAVYTFARQTASPRTIIGTSTSHAAASIIIDGASPRGPSRTTSISARHGGTQIVKRTAAPFKQPVLLNPLARVSLGREASCRPDHCTELAQGDAVTAIVADEDVIDWLRHALHMARPRAKYMARLHKLSCSTEFWSHGRRVTAGSPRQTVAASPVVRMPVVQRPSVPKIAATCIQIKPCLRTVRISNTI
jgi:hypothetical protein